MADATGVHVLRAMAAPKSNGYISRNVPSFDNIFPGDRDKLLRLFSNREDLAREFWDEVCNTVECGEAVGCGRDLEVVHTTEESPSERDRRMKVIVSSAKSLIRNLNEQTCMRLTAPPNGSRYNSADRKARGDKLLTIKALLHDLIKDVESCDWKSQRRLRLRLDYVLASTVLDECLCSELDLSGSVLIELVFGILGIETDPQDAIRGAARNFS